jgi:hypothetical protein
LEKIVSLAVDDVQKIDFDSYSDDEFAIAKMGFLSTRPNAHNLIIDEDVLRESAPSALNKWVVADMFMGEPTTHTKNEHIVGRIPRSQSVEFVYDNDGYLRAYVDTVISKIYAKDFCKAFEQDKNRAVSVEMKIFTDGEDDNIVQRFNIMGVTVLGKSIKPSCPESDIEFVRFSEEDADKFFEKQSDSLSQLKNFVEERKQSMAEKKTYKIDKSKEAMSTADWGDYDKAAMRDKIMEAKNRDTLVKFVYLLVEDGWKDAPSEHLKYPVMMFEGDKFIYNRNALSAALAYAKQNDETEVVNKIKAIYKKLDLDDDSERKEDKKMAEIEFSAVNIGDIWGMLWAAIEERQNWEYGVHGIYEEDNQKFAILTNRAKELYRLDFSLTEDGLTLADEVVEVKQEFTETDNIKKFAEPENVAEYRLADCDECDEHDDDEHDEEMSADDMKARIAQLEKDIEDRDNIIMGQNSELETLRQFKKDVEDKEKAISVEAIMAECKEYMSDDCYKQMREEGMSCEFADVDAWANKVKAYCFSAVKKTPKKEKTDVFTFAAPVEKKEHKGLWD